MNILYKGLQLDLFYSVVIIHFIYGVSDVGSIEPPEGEVGLGDAERETTNIPGMSQLIFYYSNRTRFPKNFLFRRYKSSLACCNALRDHYCFKLDAVKESCHMKNKKIRLKYEGKYSFFAYFVPSPYM